MENEVLRIAPMCPEEVAVTREIFQRAIRGTAAADYTAEQVAAWAGRADDLKEWAARRAVGRVLVAHRAGVAVGFVQIDGAYLDMLFIDPEAAGQGVATALLREALRLVDAQATVVAHASLTALPFFVARGFEVVAQGHPVIDGVELRNFHVQLTPERRSRIV